jgi:hypothetical protein
MAREFAMRAPDRIDPRPPTGVVGNAPITQPHPHLRIHRGTKNGPVVSNRLRLGIPANNFERIKEEIERQKLMQRARRQGTCVDESYDPLSWDRINS